VTKALVEWVQAWPSAFGIFRQGPSRVWTMRAIAGKIPQAEGDGFMKFPVVAFGVFVAGLLATARPLSLGLSIFQPGPARNSRAPTRTISA
jgi:hypothetical protein